MREVILIDASAGEKKEKLFAQLVYWQIQFPDQRWTVTGGRSMLSILQVHAIRFMADMRAELFVRSHGLFSYEFLNRALFCLNKANVSSEATVPEFAICGRSLYKVRYGGQSELLIIL